MGNWQTVRGFAATLLLVGAAIQPVYGQSPLPPPPLQVSPAPSPAWATAARPTGNPGEWVTVGDYPAKALREGFQGTTGFRVTIGTDGSVTGCTVTLSSGTTELDEATCRLVSQRARFSPALNAKGEAVVGQFSSRIRWVIPQNEAAPGPIALKPFSRVISFWVETDGSVSQCRVTANGIDVTASDRQNPCAAGQSVAPLTDASGKPVRRFVMLSNSLTITDPSAKPDLPKRRPGK